jgi:hypothetical protein
MKEKMYVLVLILCYETTLAPLRGHACNGDQ